MWGEGELEVHGICNRSLGYREEVVRLDQTVRNLIFGDVEISLVVIQLEVTGLKKTEKDRVRVPPSYYLEGRGRRGGAI